MRDSASQVELGKRAEVRIRVDKQVLLRPADRAPIPTLLDNLSIGGACLREVPQGWDLGEGRVTLQLEDEAELLRVDARIAWRRGTSLGLAFGETSAAHETRVDAALDVLLSDRQLHGSTSPDG